MASNFSGPEEEDPMKILQELQQKADSSTPVVVVFGQTGVGKSTFLNTLNDPTRKAAKLFKSSGTGQRVTTVTSSETLNVKIPDIEGCQFSKFPIPICTVDTPGLDDAFGFSDDQKVDADTDNLQNMAKKITELSNEHGGVSTFLLLINGSSPRIDKSMVKNIMGYSKMCGEDCFFDNLAVVVTNWHFSESAIEARKEEEEEEPPVTVEIKVGMEFRSNQIRDGLKGFFPKLKSLPVYFIDAKFGKKSIQETQMYSSQVINILKQVVDSEKFIPDVDLQAKSVDAKAKADGLAREKVLRDQKRRAEKRARRNERRADEASKGGGFLSWIITGLGVVAAPFTGGLSLGIGTVAGATTTAVIVDDW